MRGVHWANSCRLLLPLEFASGTRGTGALSTPEVGMRRVRVFMLRCSRDRACCFLERSSNIREWWSFIFCSECLKKDEKNKKVVISIQENVCKWSWISLYIDKNTFQGQRVQCDVCFCVGSCIKGCLWVMEKILWPRKWKMLLCFGMYIFIYLSFY